MHGIDDLRARATKAIGKKAAFGPDVDLNEFDSAPVPHTYMADEDLCDLPPEEQKRLIMAGLDVTQKDRSGTFFQKDTSVIHCHSQQQGIEVMPIRKALEHEWVKDYYWKLAAVDADNFTAADPRDYLKPAREAAKSICKQRYVQFGCEGQAGKIQPVPLTHVAHKYETGELSQHVH